MIITIVLAPNTEAAAASMTECDVHFFAGVGEAQKSGVSWDCGTGRDVLHSDDGLHDPRCLGGGGCIYV